MRGEDFFVIANLNTWAEIKKLVFSEVENPLVRVLCLTGQCVVGYLCTNSGGSSIEIGRGRRFCYSLS